jgi:hypothetical protein
MEPAGLDGATSREPVETNFLNIIRVVEIHQDKTGNWAWFLPRLPSYLFPTHKNPGKV